MPESGSTQRHPLVSLILLLLLVFGGAIVFTILGAVIGGAVYGFSNLLKVTGDMSANLPLLKLIQIFSATGMFIAPAIFFARMESQNWQGYLKLNPFVPVLFLLTILVMFICVPLLELSMEVNNSMKLPGFLREVEEWIRLKEDQAAELTKQLLIMNSVSSLLVNLFMIAVIPAIGEELLFRGCFQQLFQRLFKNYHLAIWLTAIIFSAIHMQFYGFLPRMLLGAMFGYLLVWGNSLWLPVLAHFVNNAVAVLMAFVYQQQGKSLDELTRTETSPWPVYLASFIGTAALLWYFYEKGRTSKVLIEGSDGTRLG